MWQEFLRFDLRYQLRQPLLWLTALALSVMAFMSASNDSFRIGGAIGNVHMNAPVVIANQLSILSIIAMFLVTVFIAGAVLRDKEVGIADMLFATPMRKLEYLFGRFFAGFLACLAIFALITLAMMLGANMPSIDPARLGAFSLYSYAWSFCVFVVPNLLFVAALLMMLAATTRSMILVYVGVLAFMVMWSVAGALGSEGGNASMAVLLDPFGVRALKQATRYYTSAESNTALPSLSGLLLMNRVIWTMIALGMFAATVILFKPQRTGTGRGWFGNARKTVAVASAPAAFSVRRIAPRFSASTAWSQWWAVLCFDAKGVIKSMPFLVMLLLAIANFVANFAIGGMRFDSAPYPLTRLLIEELAGGINSMLVIVLIFYSGELIFKERQVKISDVGDALPVPNWVPLMAKAAALVAVIFAFLFAGVGAALVIQLVQGGASVEGMLYLQGTLINAVYFILMALAILSLQTITNNKYIGYGLAIALFLSNTVLTGMDLDHKLYSFAALPTLTYSDLNGYGHFLTGWSWFALYWALSCVALLIVAQAFWQRGLALDGVARLASAMRNLRGKAGLALALSLAAWGGTGAWIHYNTNVLNNYQSPDAVLDAQADYEKLYRKTLGLPQPSLTSVRANVDIFPAERRVTIKGRYLLKNKTSAALATLRVQTDISAETTIDQLPPHTVVSDDKRFGFKVLQLAEPLAPGATLAFDFTVQVRNPGFTNSGAPDTVNHNGTMFASENFFPTLGYVQAREIDDRNERRKRGLGEPHRMPKLEDQQAHYSNFWKLFGFDGDLIDFETTVSTSAGQTAFAPGQLEQRWEKDGRNYFRYKMDKPILPFFSYQSGTWEVKKADWNGVAIEVYYDKKHAWNIDSMIKGTQRALDYNTANFGPYPHKHVRILETPLYQAFARSFPGTVPFSESLGFVSDMRKPDSVDHVFYVTAHEVAHQWWGDQVIAANVQGSAMITESLAEYSALMALEKEFGAEKVRHILRWDMDQYLAGRGKELVGELPLLRVEGQIYLQYRKGSLAFYRLREEIGEAALNRALKNFLDAQRYQSAPYATSLDLLKFIRAEAGQDKQELITDLFERIVIYDNRVLESTTRQRADGRWDVTVKLSLAKLEADGKGKESARKYDELVDVAIFAGGERVLHRQKYALKAGESSLTVTVADKPVEAGVDPYNLLIDRVAGDNRKKVTVAN
ncbi:MAG: M1 family aminopeptidase [Pseudomonadota bacterium]